MPRNLARECKAAIAQMRTSESLIKVLRLTFLVLGLAIPALVVLSVMEMI